LGIAPASLGEGPVEPENGQRPQEVAAGFLLFKIDEATSSRDPSSLARGRDRLSNHCQSCAEGELLDNFPSISLGTVDTKEHRKFIT